MSDIFSYKYECSVVKKIRYFESQSDNEPLVEDKSLVDTIFHHICDKIF